MNDTDQILEKLRSCKPEIQKRFHVRELGLFGSVSGTENGSVDGLRDSLIGCVALSNYGDDLPTIERRWQWIL